jgi:hypothetical protein
MTDAAGGHVPVTRRQWDEHMSAWFERYARPRFVAQSTLARLCVPEQGPATDRLVRDLFGLHRVVRRGTSGAEYRLFTLPHGEWIRLNSGTCITSAARPAPSVRGPLPGLFWRRCRAV